MRRWLLLALGAGLLAAPAAAHDGKAHPAPGPAAAAPALPFPMAVDARFALTDHFGRAVTEADYAGRAMLIFFGYANCEAICSVALPAMAETLALLGPDAAGIAPLMITVDPEADTPEAMRPKLEALGGGIVGLTGPEAALAEVRARFGVESELVFTGPDGRPVYAHGSFVYLVGPDGRLMALLPPILAPERMAEIIRGHLDAGVGG